jgi:hypothetical protein
MGIRSLGWILIIAGAVGLVMSVISFVVYGLHNIEEIQTVSVYGLLGLVMFSTGIEFKRRATSGI